MALVFKGTGQIGAGAGLTRGVPAAKYAGSGLPTLSVPDVPIGAVLISSQDGARVAAWVDGVAKLLPDGFGGYASTQRTARRAITVYQGVDVVAMSVPILLDGWAGQDAISPQRRQLEALAQPSGTNELTPPQPVFVTGSVPISGRWWVIKSLEPGDTVLLRASDGVALRQNYAMTLIEPPVDGVLTTNGKRYTVRKGDTLTSIAARQLGKASRWSEITTTTGKHFNDPKSVRAGQVVKLP